MLVLLDILLVQQIEQLPCVLLCLKCSLVSELSVCDGSIDLLLKDITTGGEIFGVIRKHTLTFFSVPIDVSLNPLDLMRPATLSWHLHARHPINIGNTVGIVLIRNGRFGKSDLWGS
jgi:hypothetical protein